MKCIDSVFYICMLLFLFFLYHILFMRQYKYNSCFSENTFFIALIPQHALKYMYVNVRVFGLCLPLKAFRRLKNCIRNRKSETGTPAVECSVPFSLECVCVRVCAFIYASLKLPTFVRICLFP